MPTLGMILGASSGSLDIVCAQAPTDAQAQPASSKALVQNGSINGIPVWAYGVMGMLAALIVLSVLGQSHTELSLF